MQRKPTRHFALALLMALFAIYPSRLTPEGLTTVDIAVVIVFAIAALAFLVVGILNVKRKGQCLNAALAAVPDYDSGSCFG